MSDPIDETEADVADVIDQAEPADSEPVQEALEERERIETRDPVLDEREEEDAAEAEGEPSV